MYYIYPHYLWACDINKLPRRGVIREPHTRIFVDVPCGSGVVSFWLKTWSRDLQLMLFDINPDNQRLAHRHFPACNARIADIYRLDVERNDNVWLLINSLYCLPEAITLLKRMARHMEYRVIWQSCG